MSIQFWLVALHFFCPTLTPPGMAECVLPPDGFLLPGSPGKTCTFSKQLQLASLGQECSYNLYCPTSILKHLAITFPLILSSHPFTLVYALLYFPCSSPLLHLPHTSALTPYTPLSHPLNPLTILKFPHTFHFPLYSVSVSHVSSSTLSFCHMHLYSLCYAVCLYTVHCTTGVQGSDEIPKMGNHKTEGL